MTAELSGDDLLVRAAVYRHFVDHGTAPSIERLATMVGRAGDPVRQSLERLEAGRVLALTPGTRQIWMAHPFSAVPTSYPVRTAHHTYWANCAWDALAIPSLLHANARISTSCPDCGEPVVATVQDSQLDAPPDAVVHFLVPPIEFWENIGFT